MKKRNPPMRVIRRETAGSSITYRGSSRPLVAILDPKNSTITVRLKGCRKSKTYQLEDLYVWGAQRSLL
jgi:hypothetical protein